MIPEVVFKIVVAGDGGVGKTTMLHYYLNREYKSDTRLTIGVEFFPKKIEVLGKPYNVMFWDVGGQKRFRQLHTSLVRGASGAILMFDLSRLITLSSIEEWLGILRYSKDDIPILLVGSKYDLIRQLDENSVKQINDYGLEMKEKHNLFDYCITSSKIAFNIDHAFRMLLEKVKNYHSIESILKGLKDYRL